MAIIKNSDILIYISLCILSNSLAKEVLPENCHCRDWYGGCRQLGATWTDDNTWTYTCSASDGAPATFTGCEAKIARKNGRTEDKLIPAGSNETIDGFWHSCEMNEIRLKLAQEPRCNVNGTDYHVGDNFRDNTWQWLCLETGRWVTGCYYQNETSDWNLLKIGEVQYNGLIKHTCDRFKDNPGRVQYHAEIRTDVPFKNPPNKGTNKNFPELVDNRLKTEPIPWLHQNVNSFVANEVNPNAKIRYLPKSNAIHQPTIFSS